MNITRHIQSFKNGDRMDKKSKRVFLIVVILILTIVMLFSFFVIYISLKKKRNSVKYEFDGSQFMSDNNSEGKFWDEFEIEEEKQIQKPSDSEISVVGSQQSLRENGKADIIEDNSVEEKDEIEQEGNEKVEPIMENLKQNGEESQEGATLLLEYVPIDIATIPEYTQNPYCIINDNKPSFSDKDKRNQTFEYYSPLDGLGRCGVATANLAKELMPSEERGPMGHIKPTGWHTIKYPEQIGDIYLYNRCHLIAFSLAGENDNVQNLITGTRFMNVSGMLPFEKEVVSYIDATNNHVLYRVIPYFIGDELVARGVQIEAYSIEDNGKGICFNVFVYNVQPGIEIDYLTGDSWVKNS